MHNILSQALFLLIINNSLYLNDRIIQDVYRSAQSAVGVWANGGNTATVIQQHRRLKPNRQQQDTGNQAGDKHPETLNRSNQSSGNRLQRLVMSKRFGLRSRMTTEGGWIAERYRRNARQIGTINRSGQQRMPTAADKTEPPGGGSAKPDYSKRAISALLMPTISGILTLMPLPGAT